MRILVDIPTEEGKFSGENQFFFSVVLSKTEGIAFDYTFAGHRVMKQKLEGEVETDEEPTDVWESIEITDGKLTDRYRVEWVDRRKKGKAIINGKIWKTVWEKSLPEDIKKRLMGFSSEIYKHKDSLGELDELFKSLDAYMEKIVKAYI